MLHVCILPQLSEQNLSQLLDNEAHATRCKQWIGALVVD
jgi:hypothetical protein